MALLFNDLQGDDSAVDMFPRCYCLISRHPFLRLHFHVLQVLLGMYKEDLLIRQASGDLGQPAGESAWAAAGPSYVRCSHTLMPQYVCPMHSFVARSRSE